MKIVYDNIIFASQKFGGVSTVWYELIKRALRDRLDLSFIEFQPVENILRKQLRIEDCCVRKVPASLRKVLKYSPVRYDSGTPFIFHSSYYRTCFARNAINVTTVHDFTNELFQNGSSALKERFIKHRAIRKSDYIICISENTRNDFFRYFPDFPHNKVRTIYNGVSDEFHLDSEMKDFPYKDRGYILFVGSRDGYKRFDLVVDSLKGHDYDLVCTGDPLTSVEMDMIRGYEHRVHYAGRVDNAKLNVLYNHAFALVYPSEYEGFGLPVLEAQKAGCPVIAFRGSSIPEVIGQTPLLMENPTAEEIVSKISLLKEVGVREDVVKSGFLNVARFSWEKMYRETCELYSEALNNTI